MGYVGGELAPLFDPDKAWLATRRMADALADRGHDFVTANTPVATGNLRTSWYRTPARPVRVVGARGWEARVQTDVGYAPHVEWDTRPHEIRPRRPGGVLRFVGRDGSVVFTRRVRHPGTKGAHMMAIATAMADAGMQQILQPELARWATEQVRGA